MRVIAALILCLASGAVQARPSPYPPPTQFDGDRYSARVAQGASARDVTRVLTRKPRAHQRQPRGQRRPVPVPRQPVQKMHKLVPGEVKPLGMPDREAEPQTLAGGFVREVGRGVSQIIGGRPAGCPHRFCGCALSLHIFGKIVPRLNLAANWRAFPRAAPGPGMVAARSGHVFKLLAHVGGTRWRVWDANSGRGRIRIHNRSIAGYVIVNPRGGSS